MKQLEYYPSRDKYRLWDATNEVWFDFFSEIGKYLRQQKIYAIRTKTLPHSNKRLLTKAGVRVYALND